MDFDAERDEHFGLYAITVDGLCWVLDEAEAAAYIAAMSLVMQNWPVPKPSQVMQVLVQVY